MSKRCTAEQIAEGVTIWSIQDRGTPVMCSEYEDCFNLKPLDLLISTIEVFKSAFHAPIVDAYDAHKQRFLFQKSNFNEYLKIRCLLLAQKDGWFDFILTCTFVSDTVLGLCYRNKCYHLSEVACEVLTEVLTEKFSEKLKSDAGWKELMAYCKKIHAAVFPSKNNRPPDHSRPRLEHKNKAKRKKLVSAEKSTGSKSIDQEDRKKFNSEKRNAKVTFRIVSNKTEKETAADSPVDDDESGIESFDDNSDYWDFERMSLNSIWKRITDSEEHMICVIKLLTVIEERLNPDCLSLYNYENLTPKDEVIEKSGEISTEGDEAGRIQLGDQMDCSLEGIPGNTSPNKVNSENITDEVKIPHVGRMRSLQQNERRCRDCDDLPEFKMDWWERFLNKYSNTKKVTDFIPISLIPYYSEEVVE